MPRSSRLPALFLVLGALLSACSDDAPPAEDAPPPPTPQEETLNGVWQETGGSARVMVLGDGQQLHLLGFEDLQGYGSTKCSFRMQTSIMPSCRSSWQSLIHKSF